MLLVVTEQLHNWTASLHFSSQWAAQCPFLGQEELVEIYPELFARVYRTVETSESRIIQKYTEAVEYMGFQSRNFKKQYNIISFNSTNLHSYSTWEGEGTHTQNILILLFLSSACRLQKWGRAICTKSEIEVTENLEVEEITLMLLSQNTSPHLISSYFHLRLLKDTSNLQRNY